MTSPHPGPGTAENLTENALAERVSRIRQQECSMNATFAGQDDGRRATRPGIEIHNTRRPHRGLGAPSPRNPGDSTSGNG